MEDSYITARDRVFAEAPSELRHLRAHSSAAFYVYLCMRATQRGWSPRSWAAALRYGVKAIVNRPSVIVDVLRGRAPLASLRLSARELGAKGT